MLRRNGKTYKATPQKKKEATRKTEMKRTGGGPPPSELKAWEEKIIGVLSNEILSGIEGGVDSLDTDSNKSGVESTCMSGKRNFGMLFTCFIFLNPFSLKIRQHHTSFEG
uniref:Uncharacterized protein LOC111111261 n=1 Tax=Crassostrea virginica TaxID=6565 RepID=A0A8B8BKH1_CRAVI|nr:uncharacterized protein LOC111111261 [Crassostrea virginica]